MTNHNYIAESGKRVPNYKIQDVCNNCVKSSGCNDLFGDVYRDCSEFNSSVHSTGWCPQHKRVELN